MEGELKKLTLVCSLSLPCWSLYPLLVVVHVRFAGGQGNQGGRRQGGGGRDQGEGERREQG